VNETPSIAPQTVEFDVELEDGTHVGSLVTWALPSRGDRLRIDDPQKQPVYEVLYSYIEPDNITVVVRPFQECLPESSNSPFARQEQGAGGFQ
jgi:hypothetical protein